MSENVLYTSMSSDLRLPQIVEGQIQGKTQTQIAKTLGVSEKTIQRDTRTPLYETLVGQFFTKYMDTIHGFLEGEADTNRLEALKELGRMYRAGMTRHTQHTEDSKLTVDINITEDRKKKEALIDSLELTEDQYKILEDTLTESPKV
jgi:hypothetical protein